MIVFASLAVACDSPAQIVEITPQRGAVDVHTNLPIQIRFDRAVDRQSVIERFQVLPEVPGKVRWRNSNTLIFEHAPLAVDTDYTVVLGSGFKDQAGVTSQFRHSWRFHTELAPVVTSSSPGNREKGIDPTSYLSIAFNRDMDAGSFQGAVSLTPSTPYQVRSDLNDPHRVVIAPRALLQPGTDYRLEIASQALDADGNHVPATRISFSTGEVRSLQHWITFVTSEVANAAGGGIWMVDDNRFPRLLTDLPVDRLTWTPDATSVLVRHPDGGWALLTPGSATVDLPFVGGWAAYLGPELGYLYLAGDSLDRLRPNLTIEHIASGVGEVAVAPDLAKIAFTVSGASSGEIDGYDLALRARYVLLRDGEAASGLAWSPNGLRLAYVLAGASPAQSRLRVKSLSGAGTVTTVATGEIVEPAWLADSNYITFSALIPVDGQPRWNVFRINSSLPPLRLTTQLALATTLATDATSPRPSPDGHQIAFLSGPTSSAQIWLMNADGTGLQRLTTFDARTFPYSCQALHWAGS